MLLRELLLEASYNEFIEKLKRTYPGRRAEYIQDQVNWAKQVLKRDDRVMWFLKILKQTLSHGFDWGPTVGYDGNFPELKQDLQHYFQNDAFTDLERVKRYQFVDPSKRDVDLVMIDLANIENYEHRVADLVEQYYLEGKDTVEKIYKEFISGIFYQNKTYLGQDLKDLPKDIARMLKRVKAEHDRDYKSEDAAAFESGEAQVVYKGEGVAIVSCKSMAGSLAAITYSNGQDDTKWCTGQRNPKNNLFNHYHHTGGRSMVLHFPNEGNNLDKIGIFGVEPWNNQSIQHGVGGNFQDKGNVFLDDKRWAYLVDKYGLRSVPALQGIRGIGFMQELESAKSLKSLFNAVDFVNTSGLDFTKEESAKINDLYLTMVESQLRSAQEIGDLNVFLQTIDYWGAHLDLDQLKILREVFDKIVDNTIGSARSVDDLEPILNRPRSLSLNYAQSKKLFMAYAKLTDYTNKQSRDRFVNILRTYLFNDRDIGHVHMNRLLKEPEIKHIIDQIAPPQQQDKT